MSKPGHWIYIAIMVLLVLAVLVLIVLEGFSYYLTGLEERFYHADHNALKPSGILGHGYGIAGSLAMIIGVSTYMVRKRSKRLFRAGQLKYWLEFHIFLNTLGPLLVLFHTSFKFGGLVAISFWSMVAVFLSGIIGRFIYIQIPRTIEGRELSLNEVKGLRRDVGEIIRNVYKLDEDSAKLILESAKVRTGKQFGGIVKQYFEDSRMKKNIRALLKKNNLSGIEIQDVMRLIQGEIKLNRRIGRLRQMQNLFKYWHVAHFPFALVMLIIMVVHVAVTIIFGYTWIF